MHRTACERRRSARSARYESVRCGISRRCVFRARFGRSFYREKPVESKRLCAGKLRRNGWRALSARYGRFRIRRCGGAKFFCAGFADCGGRRTQPHCDRRSRLRQNDGAAKISSTASAAYRRRSAACHAHLFDCRTHARKRTSRQNRSVSSAASNRDDRRHVRRRCTLYTRRNIACAQRRALSRRSRRIPFVGFADAPCTDRKRTHHACSRRPIDGLSRVVSAAHGGEPLSLRKLRIEIENLSVQRPCRRNLLE